MNITITENLKAFRKARGNTQEELAKNLGLTVQAVSKWERGDGYPDITLLPSIALFYEKTVDELLGCGEIARRRRIAEITARFEQNIGAGDIESSIDLMRGALREFPNELAFMSLLSGALLLARNDEDLDECISLCEKVLNKSTEDEQRYDALKTLVQAYSRKNDKSKAKEYADKLPDLHYTYNSVAEHVLEGEELMSLAQSNIRAYIHLMRNSIEALLRAKECASEEAKQRIESEIADFIRELSL